MNEIALKYSSYCPNFKISSIIGSPKLYYICIHTLPYYTQFFWSFLPLVHFFFRRHSTDTSSTLFSTYPIIIVLLMTSLPISFSTNSNFSLHKGNCLCIPHSYYLLCAEYCFIFMRSKHKNGTWVSAMTCKQLRSPEGSR